MGYLVFAIAPFLLVKLAERLVAKLFVSEIGVTRLKKSMIKIYRATEPARHLSRCLQSCIGCFRRRPVGLVYILEYRSVTKSNRYVLAFDIPT